MSTNSTPRKGSFRTALLGLTALAFSIGTAQAQTVYGLSSVEGTTAASLVSFNLGGLNTSTATPVSTRITITGITSGQTLVGLDSRPNTGELFALGYNATTQQAQLYIINRTSAAATAVGSALTLNLGTDLKRIGFDFNPTVDRIRVTSSNRNNYRLNPVNGTLAATDGTLAYATTDVNANQTPSVGSSAYTNSYIGASATTLYNIDEQNNRLVTQVPPNNGTLNTVGSINISFSGLLTYSDLDIRFNPTTALNNAVLSVTDPSVANLETRLFSLDLANGATTLVGRLNTGSAEQVTDITFAIDRPATLPAITGQLVYGLAGTNLISFDSAQPSLIRAAVGITGVDANQTLVGLDVRPLNNALYALGYNATTQTGQLYTINAATGVATPTSAGIALALGTGSISFDFNPTVDRIRVVGANRNNYRLNPVNGTLAATDGQITYASGANTPTTGAVAYTNSFTGANATSGTTLYNYDEVLNVLSTQSTANPPADGQLTPVGSSGFTANTNPANVDLDIYSTGVGVNTAYMVATVGTSANSTFYTVNLGTGAATAVSTIGNGITVRDIAVAAATGVATGTRDRDDLASGLGLYPNPAVAEANIAFTLPRPAQVTLVVTDALGRQVESRNVGTLGAGAQSIRWSSAAQRQGIYFFTLLLDGQAAGTRRGVILK
ncbi:DUF4394 domain-containing protein [Hymenobacter metallicola]|uniref:DUF4394 domain-containing protein n=1 Tax=Hymenobacter metallicola TaxID=2563114 RepID=A0A4Z0Q0M4_9BACT|nr:DUF4394 domain-containing protein [Hymenobacter metallicola]TGE23036.1 DUF4394 domain-containing protein [Hymenobacter metallicola]